MQYLRIIMSDRACRDAVDSPSLLHPTIEHAVEQFRKENGSKPLLLSITENVSRAMKPCIQVIA